MSPRIMVDSAVEVSVGGVRICKAADGPAFGGSSVGIVILPMATPCHPKSLKATTSTSSSLLARSGSRSTATLATLAPSAAAAGGRRNRVLLWAPTVIIMSFT